MLKIVFNMLVGAFVAASITTAIAVTGLVPGSGPQLIDGLWLNGLASGQNQNYQSGITAHAGGTQAACLILNNGSWLYELDTVASSGDSICLPYAAAGSTLSIRNAGANLANFFAQNTNNPLTAATDTINGQTNTTTFTLTANWVADCFSAKNGAWSCARGN
jgi:hypothetical protein